MKRHKHEDKGSEKEKGKEAEGKDSSSSLRIAVIGSGPVGSTLGGAWADKGHLVTFTSRDPSQKRLQELATAHPTAKVAATKEGLVDAAVVLLSIPWKAVEEFVPQIADLLADKIVIDCTNPLKTWHSLEVGTTTSAAEIIQSLAPKAKVVKAFNSMSTAVMRHPDFGHEQRANTLICGNDAGARLLVSQLAQDIGFEAVDCGDLKIARLVEPAACLWIHCAYELKMGGSQGRDLALNFVHRK